jgi:prephenate dehydratase
MSRPNIPKIVTLGPAGSFHELAAKQFFPGAQLNLVPMVEQIFQQVEAGTTGLIALLDSYSEDIKQRLAALSHSYAMLEQVEMPISLCVATAPENKNSRIDTILSHPQAFTHCEEVLRKHFPYAVLQACESTSAAAKEITKAMKPHSAVICHPDTAAAYGLHILLDADTLGAGHTSTFCLFGLR